METKPDRKTGKRISDRRHELGLTQREIATKSVSYAYVSRIEAGTRSPSWAALLELAEKLDSTALYLATGRDHDCPVCGR